MSNVELGSPFAIRASDKPFEFEIAPGWTATIRPIKPFELVTPGSTAKHEAYHAGVFILKGKELVLASRIPGPGYLGITIPTEFDAAAAMAADAMGCEGTSHDRLITFLHGSDPGSAASVARGLIFTHMDEIDALASLIQLKGTVSGSEARAAMDSIANPEAEVILRDPFGKERYFVMKTRSGAGYFIPVDLSNAPETPTQSENWREYILSPDAVPQRDRPLRDKIYLK